MVQDFVPSTLPYHFWKCVCFLFRGFSKRRYGGAFLTHLPKADQPLALVVFPPLLHVLSWSLKLNLCEEFVPGYFGQLSLRNPQRGGVVKGKAKGLRNPSERRGSHKSSLVFATLFVGCHSLHLETMVEAMVGIYVESTHSRVAERCEPPGFGLWVAFIAGRHLEHLEVSGNRPCRASKPEFMCRERGVHESINLHLLGFSSSFFFVFCCCWGGGSRAHHVDPPQNGFGFPLGSLLKP